MPCHFDIEEICFVMEVRLGHPRSTDNRQPVGRARRPREDERAGSAFGPRLFETCIFFIA